MHRFYSRKFLQKATLHKQDLHSENMWSCDQRQDTDG